MSETAVDRADAILRRWFNTRERDEMVILGFIADEIREAEQRGRLAGLKEAEGIATKEQFDCEKMAPVSVALYEAWMACSMTAKGIAQKIAALSTAPTTATEGKIE